MPLFRLFSLALALMWISSTLHANGLEQSLRDGHAAGNLPGLHSVVVIQNGETLAEVYFEAHDQVWGTPIGMRRHGPDTLHDLRSVSKSVVGLLYGMALADGVVPAPDASLMAAFPDYADLSTPERNTITVADVLSMQMGNAWDETHPYSDPRNSEIAMEQAADRIRFILERPMTTTPGTVFNYSGGTTALLAELIERGTGKPLDVYARERLFSPLGIHRYEWIRGSDGRPAAASGLRLTARDLARIGELILNDGRKGDQQIVPASWLAASLAPQVNADGLRYGYQWWLSTAGGPEWAAALGNGGQRMTIVKPLGLVAVLYAGNYNQADAWEIPVSVISKYIVPALGLD